MKILPNKAIWETKTLQFQFENSAARIQEKRQ